MSEVGRLQTLSSFPRFLSQEELKVMAIHESKSVASGKFTYFYSQQSINGQGLFSLHPSSCVLEAYER